MSDIEPWTRQLLSVIVSQLCKTIGWHSISTTCLQILVDILDRYLKQLGTNIHDYTEHYNHTFPALEEIHLAFVDMGINVEDLKEYIDYVTPITIKQKIPQYPLEKKSNLNFLKPGSREVVTRPVHIHEHLPAMYPELSDENYTSHDTTNKEECSLPNLSGVGNTSSFKKFGDNIEVINNKHFTRLIPEEIGRPLRKLSCVMMTTSGFLSHAREGKAPEARLPKLPINNNNQSNHQCSYPTVLPEVKGDHKKSGHSKSSGSGKPVERKIREEHQNGKEDFDDTKIKKLTAVKEINKLKAMKPAFNKSDSVEIIKPSKPEKLKVIAPFSSKELKTPKFVKLEKIVEKIPEPEIVEEKLTTEPNKQKLNIFKRISKVKEERAESPVLKTNAEKNAQINECIEAVVKRSREKIEPAKFTFHEKNIDVNSDPVLVEETHQIVSEPSPVMKHIKRKKKQKLHDSEPIKKLKTNNEIIHHNEIEKPKPMEPEPPPYSFFKQLQTTPGLMPPSLSANLLIPRFPHPFINFIKSDPNCPHPQMPNLPLPPPTLMQAHIDSQKPIVKVPELDNKIINNNTMSMKKLKKKMKKDKKEKDKKKREKKNKLKDKEKLEKKKDLKKIKVKSKEKMKKKEKLNTQKEEINEDPSVPKLKLKIATNNNSPQLSPSGIPSPKIVIKPIVKHDETPIHLEISNHPIKEREQSPELAKISAFIGKPIKQKNSTKIMAEQSPPVVTAKPVIDPTIVTIPTKSKKSSSGVEIKVKNKEKQNKIKKVEEVKPKPAPYYYDAEGNQVWVCPTCGAQDDGSPMIGCDGCDAWYHWVCVGIKSPPDSAKWFCGTCSNT